MLYFHFWQRHSALGLPRDEVRWSPTCGGLQWNVTGTDLNHSARSLTQISFVETSSEELQIPVDPLAYGRAFLEGPTMASVTPSSVLAQNLDRLLALKGLGRKEAAEAIGISYKWLRRAVSQGLGRPDQRNAPHLQRLTTFFGLRRIDDLWRPSLLDQQPK